MLSLVFVCLVSKIIGLTIDYSTLPVPFEDNIVTLQQSDNIWGHASVYDPLSDTIKIFCGTSIVTYNYNTDSFVTCQSCLSDNLRRYDNGIVLIDNIAYIMDCCQGKLSSYDLLSNEYTSELFAFPVWTRDKQIASNNIDKLVYVTGGENKYDFWIWNITGDYFFDTSNPSSLLHKYVPAEWYNNVLCIFGDRNHRIIECINTINIGNNWYSLSDEFNGLLYYKHSLALNNGIVLIIGGYYACCGITDDIYVFDFVSERMYISNTKLFISAYGASSAFIPHLDKVFVLGGVHRLADGNYTSLLNIQITYLTTLDPTVNPTETPSIHPSNDPSDNPTAQPTNVPSMQPTETPTLQPTQMPSASPSMIPSNDPSVDPTVFPSNNPTEIPTNEPSILPTINPTIVPSLQPTNIPSDYPTMTPSNYPSIDPTMSPSNHPTFKPTQLPTSLKDKKYITGFVNLTTSADVSSLTNEELERILIDAIVSTTELSDDYLIVNVIIITLQNSKYTILYEINYYDNNLDSNLNEDTIMNEELLLSEMDQFNSNNTNIKTDIELNSLENNSSKSNSFVDTSYGIPIIISIVLLVLIVILQSGYIIYKSKYKQKNSTNLDKVHSTELENVAKTDTFVDTGEELATEDTQQTEGVKNDLKNQIFLQNPVFVEGNNQIKTKGYTEDEIIKSGANSETPGEPKIEEVRQIIEKQNNDQNESTDEENEELFVEVNTTEITDGKTSDGSNVTKGGIIM